MLLGSRFLLTHGIFISVDADMSNGRISLFTVRDCSATWTAFTAFFNVYGDTQYYILSLMYKSVYLRSHWYETTLVSQDRLDFERTWEFHHLQNLKTFIKSPELKQRQRSIPFGKQLSTVA